MRFHRFRFLLAGRHFLLSVAFLLTACASDTSTQEQTSTSCTEQECQEQNGKKTAIENARNDEKRRNEMIKDNKQPIPGTYYPVDQE